MESMKRKFEVGDEIIIFQDSCSVIPSQLFYLTGFIEDHTITGGRYKIKVPSYKMGGNPTTWFVHPNDFRKITKLDRILK